jgi:hypothetical protein
MIYVINGRGFAIIDEEQTSVPIETGSVLYIPMAEGHSLTNADPKAPKDILLVTTPVKPEGLGDFFRFATVQPGHPPSTCPKRSSSARRGSCRVWRRWPLPQHVLPELLTNGRQHLSMTVTEPQALPDLLTGHTIFGSKVLIMQQLLVH